MSQGARILIYSHDTYGLGHLRRSLLIAGRLAAQPGRPAVLVATGSPWIQAFDLPRGCDTLKLPAVQKQPDGGYRSRTLSLPLRQMIRLRGELVRAAARSFRADLVLVDHSPLGMGGELRALFRDVSRWRHRPHLVLGLRDILDDAVRVETGWTREGVWEVIEETYGLVLVYGDPALRTTAQELELERRYPGKVVHVGYLAGANGEVPAPATNPPIVVVTAGGGGDGQRLLHAYASYLDSLEAPAPFRSVILTGPFLSRRRLRQITRRLSRVRQPMELRRFVPGADRLVRRAAAVVAMAGYNTVVEILSAAVPALLVPRETPRLEQRIRAERLARHGAVACCLRDELCPPRFASFLEAALSSRASHSLRLDGLDHAVAALERLLPGGGRTETPRQGALHARTAD